MEHLELHISVEPPDTTDAIALMRALSSALSELTGSSGEASFSVEDLRDTRARFVIVRDANGQAVGCGAIRPLDSTTAEVKRVYAKHPNQGIGLRILNYLEQEASRIGFTSLRLETRKINQVAVDFYLRNHYRIIPNYGAYKNRDEAVCLEKHLQ